MSPKKVLLKKPDLFYEPQLTQHYKKYKVGEVVEVTK